VGPFLIPWLPAHASSKDTTIRIYDRESLTYLHTITGHTMPINALATDSTTPEHPDHIASASSDGNWIVWDMISGEEIRRGTGDGRGLACITWAVSSVSVEAGKLTSVGAVHSYGQYRSFHQGLLLRRFLLDPNNRWSYRPRTVHLGRSQLSNNRFRLL
jgi:WD40 repeat protein